MIYDDISFQVHRDGYEMIYDDISFQVHRDGYDHLFRFVLKQEKVMDMITSSGLYT